MPDTMRPLYKTRILKYGLNPDAIRIKARTVFDLVSGNSPYPVGFLPGEEDVIAAVATYRKGYDHLAKEWDGFVPSEKNLRIASLVQEHTSRLVKGLVKNIELKNIEKDIDGLHYCF